jgi:hypothetical protein
MTCFLSLIGPFLWRAVVNLFGKEELLKPIPASRRNGIRQNMLFSGILIRNCNERKGAIQAQKIELSVV